MESLPTDFYTVTELADELGITPRTIRFLRNQGSYQASKGGHYPCLHASRAGTDAAHTAGQKVGIHTGGYS